MNNNNVMYLPLGNKRKSNAMILQKDFEELMSFGISPKWSYHLGHVWVWHNRRKLPIARLICDAGKGQKVVLVDKNPLNLKRDNLLLTIGTSKHRTRDFV